MQDSVYVSNDCVKEGITTVVSLQGSFYSIHIGVCSRSHIVIVYLVDSLPHIVVRYLRYMRVCTAFTDLVQNLLRVANNVFGHCRGPKWALRCLIRY